MEQKYFTIVDQTINTISNGGRGGEGGGSIIPPTHPREDGIITLNGKALVPIGDFLDSLSGESGKSV